MRIPTGVKKTRTCELFPAVLHIQQKVLVSCLLDGGGNLCTSDVSLESTLSVVLGCAITMLRDAMMRFSLAKYAMLCYALCCAGKYLG